MFFEFWNPSISDEIFASARKSWNSKDFDKGLSNEMILIDTINHKILLKKRVTVFPTNAFDHFGYIFVSDNPLQK